MAEVFDPLVYLSQRPLMTPSLAIFVFVLLIIICIFVDCVIGEMHEHVVEVFGIRRLIRTRRKPRQSLLKHISPQRTDAIEQYIDPQVEF